MSANSLSRPRSKSNAPWNDWYHCMGHTYGTWLPGDPRGFRTRHRREHIEGDYKHPPPKGLYAKRYEHAKNLMKRDPVFLTVEQRLLIVRLMVESLQRRNFKVVVACVTDVHFHILARFPAHDPRHWVGVCKKESSHYAKQQNLAPPGGLWAVRTKSVPLTSRDHQLNVAKYIFKHRKQGGAVWYRFNVIAPVQRDRA